ncbi:MAG TPA: murein biosynthesis integral membrane protein MurJ, partial [Bradyrhizobium sp.]|nr:murein biosynthesis integral membrane protein MurJ [Bradyrhizobium sp.]
IDAAARRRLPRIVMAALAMGGLLWLKAASASPLAGAHGLAQAAMLGVLIIAGVAIYGLLLVLLGVINWADAVAAVRHSPPRDLRR